MESWGFELLLTHIALFHLKNRLAPSEQLTSVKLKTQIKSYFMSVPQTQLDTKGQQRLFLSLLIIRLEQGLK